MNIFKSCVERQKRIDKVVDILGNDEIAAKNLLVKDRIINPAHYVVMLGETSSGKSALINSIFDKKLLIESVRPTTGIVTEVVIDSSQEESLIAIKKDGNSEPLDNEQFETLTTKPGQALSRLRYIGPCKDAKYDGMRLFDTPGYGSLINEHEEVLKEFIPESDIIVYVVSYRTGLGDDDFQFLKYVGEIINDRVEVVLAINMCPKELEEDNKRVIEIQKAINECIHKDVKTFFIESSSEKKPETSKLWDYIYERVNASEKREELSETLKNYQNYVLGECDIKINSKIASIQCEKEQVQERINIIKDFLDKKEYILATIDDEFARIKVRAIKLIDRSDIKVKELIEQYIYDESKWTMKEETCSLMQHYYVPKLTNEETENLLNYIEDEIISIDRTVDNMLNEEITKLESNVRVNMPSYTEVMEGIIEKHIGDAIKQAMGEMFRRTVKKRPGRVKRYNIYSRNLKKLSNALEKTTIGEINNNLNNLLKTVKATSIKGITEYLNVFTDSIFILHDTLTWQSKISEISKEAVDNWANDLDKAIRKYLDELKESKKEEITTLFEELNEEFTNNQEELKHISSEELVRLKKEIEFLIHKCLLITL